MSFRYLLFCILILAASAGSNAGNLDDAQWIGAPGDRMPMYADYLPIFKISCSAYIPEECSATLVYGKGDPRLTNGNLNIYGICEQADSTAIKVRIDGRGMLDVYRIGYHPEDTPAEALASFPFTTCTNATYKLTIASNHGITGSSRKHGAFVKTDGIEC